MASHLINFDIDHYLNPWVPPNRLDVLPYPISRFLGYRKEQHSEPPAVVQWISSVVGTLAGLLVVGAVLNYAPGINKFNPPVLIASFGASAVLDYNTIRSPLSQPRNSIVGHTISAILGIAISKLFQLNSDFDNIQWVSAAVGCACATLAMSVTNSIHPPGGATAVLASTTSDVIAMGWWFAPVVLLCSTLITAVALVTNNVLRQYPVFWWTPEEVGQGWKRGDKDEMKDVEKGDEKSADADSERTLHKTSSNVSSGSNPNAITVIAEDMELPANLELSQEELRVLEGLQKRLRG